MCYYNREQTESIIKAYKTSLQIPEEGKEIFRQSLSESLKVSPDCLFSEIDIIYKSLNTIYMSDHKRVSDVLNGVENHTKKMQTHTKDSIKDLPRKTANLFRGQKKVPKMTAKIEYQKAVDNIIKALKLEKNITI